MQYATGILLRAAFRFRIESDGICWCLRAESNHRHGDFQSPALPTELQRHIAIPQGKCWRPGWDLSRGLKNMPPAYFLRCFAPPTCSRPIFLLWRKMLATRMGSLPRSKKHATGIFFTVLRTADLFSPHLLTTEKDVGDPDGARTHDL